MTTKYSVAQVLAGASQGGAENFYVRLVAGLQESGNTEQIAFLRGYPHRVQALEHAGVGCHSFRFGSVLHVIDHFRYLRALRNAQPDIVMTWMNRASKATPPGKYRLVCRLGHYYDLKYYRHADYWVGIAKGICNHMIKGGIPAKNIIHIPNFADETEVTALPRSSFNTPDGVPVILAAGRLHENKGFDILLKALVKLPDVALWLAGAGPEEQKLKKLCQELRLEDRVRFLGWRTDVTALMKSVDLFVCPSRHEGLGSIVMESWAHDCPIVATNSQGPGEAIEHGVNGLLTPVDEVEPLAEAMQQVLGDKTLREQLRNNAKSHYLTYYSKKVIVSQYEEFYESILT